MKRISTRRQPARRALTLVEMLVTLVLTGLLLTAALRAITAMGQSRRLYAQRTLTGGQERLEWLLRRDLEHLQRFRNLPDGVECKTHLSWRADWGATRHVPTTVVYRIETRGNWTWLSRREDGRGGTDLLWRDVTGIRIASTGGRTIPASYDGQWNSVGDGGVLDLRLGPASGEATTWTVPWP